MVPANAEVTFPCSPPAENQIHHQCAAFNSRQGVEAKERQVIGIDNGFVLLTGQRNHCIPQGVGKEKGKELQLEI